MFLSPGYHTETPRESRSLNLHGESCMSLRECVPGCDRNTVELLTGQAGADRRQTEVSQTTTGPLYGCQRLKIHPANCSDCNQLHTAWKLAMYDVSLISVRILHSMSLVSNDPDVFIQTCATKQQSVSLNLSHLQEFTFLHFHARMQIKKEGVKMARPLQNYIFRWCF